MTKALHNPYTWVLVIPLIAFICCVTFGVDPDLIGLWGRFYCVALIAYVGARYVGRAPILMVKGDMSPEGRNITGFALFLVAILLQQAYGRLYISMDRPVWLSVTYFNPAFVILASVGMTLVASSVPRFPFPPFGSGNGLGVTTSFLVGFLSATLLILSQHVVAVVKFLLLPVIHAF